MLSRRHLRIKALQALYAFTQSHNDNLVLGEKELLKSINKLYEIYVYQLSLLLEVVEYAEKRLEENKQKFFPTSEDLAPNRRFIDNRFLKQLSENKDLARYTNTFKILWADQDQMIRKLYIGMRELPEYQEYMKKPDCSYDDDKEVVQQIIKKVFTRSELLQFFYEEKNIHWSDDFYTANLLVVKTIKSWDESWDEMRKLPLLFKEQVGGGENEDREFLIQLFRKTIVKDEEYSALIENKVKNWEMDRIAVMDILLIKMAIVELLEFPSIPIKVTLNEYIELAKMFSTPKSKIFINGILDKMIVELKSQKKIKKMGRGLIGS
ncbi:MAG: transcription antitermination factor NusB [Chlorobi bacterium]|nr:transcription antitermination factor NusB [Chlorobiota bacterium]